MLRYTRKEKGKVVVWIMTPLGWQDALKEKCIGCVAESDCIEIRKLFVECPFCGAKVY